MSSGLPENVQEQGENNGGKKLGGVTGKGFLPGKSGNPGGRPKRPRLTRLLSRALKVRDENLKQAQLILVEQLIQHAIKGDSACIKEIFNRIDGPLPKEVKAELTGNVTHGIRVVDLTPEYMARVLQILEQCETRDSGTGEGSGRESRLVPSPPVREANGLPGPNGS